MWTALFLIVIVLGSLALSFSIRRANISREGLTTAEPIPESGLPAGYYVVGEDKMAKIPYGYQLDPSDTTKKTIFPLTTSNFFRQKPVVIPQSGIPDGYYMVSQGYMAVLPPGMKPKVRSIDEVGKMTYEAGYINENDYYALSVPIPDKPGTTPPVPVKIPPPGTYFNDKGGLSILPYGKIPNTKADGTKMEGTNGIGYSENKDLILSRLDPKYKQSTASFDANDVDVQYHDTADNILKQNDVFEDASYGAITVRDKDGNLVVLPRRNLQGDITFYTPGTFKYQSAGYVPNYEDSVFLSRATYIHTYGQYEPTDVKKGFCEAYKGDKEKLEALCNDLPPDACASSSCCVLLGGAKCVYGGETGPNNRSHYGDVLLRNKDFYYYKGKCYGNCANEV